MGTRHIISVFVDGVYKVAQYGQWDGYPGGQGASVLAFLRGMDREKFLANVRAAHYGTKEEMEVIDADATKLGAGAWQKVYPQLSRDTSSKLLQLIQDSEPGMILHDQLSFVSDSLFCEWAYVIDFDKNTFEVFEGFNQKPLVEGDRFFSMPLRDKSKSARGDDVQYHPVKLRATFDMAKLPTDAEFHNTFKDPEDEDSETPTIPPAAETGPEITMEIPNRTHRRGRPKGTRGRRSAHVARHLKHRKKPVAPNPIRASLRDRVIIRKVKAGKVRITDKILGRAITVKASELSGAVAAINGFYS